jgi:hypothetical protein
MFVGEAGPPGGGQTAGLFVDREQIERPSEGLAGVFRPGATRAIQQESLGAGDLGAHPVRLLRRGCR